ncbi:hypothetical protein SAMN05216312_102361 [Cohnella sp. OV330]|uniref:hypothetical protein n=1 Tax=Cohnella sp. OV330 TaxID=1855288 RepID=UPI0008F0D9A9|nr:hypothetical protein [Cohnella sp. OV330]SFA93623.1 hypothetical protein SAMN05216312_102361 [Cohnella sp. OV330]
MEMIAVHALRKTSRAKPGRRTRSLRRKSVAARRKPGLKKRAVAGGKRRIGRVRSRKRRTANPGAAFNQAYNEGYNAGFAKGFEDGHQLAYDQQV